jgi:hypothetical protein
MSMQLLSRAVPKVLGKTFERKYIALGRIVTYWKEIIGPDFAARAQPAKIHYRKAKTKGEKPTATLEIAASSADCAVLQYQKDVIIQRITSLLGDTWIKDVKFSHRDIRQKPKRIHRTKTLTSDEKNYLSQVLEAVDDPDLKDRLARFGQALIQDKTS